MDSNKYKHELQTDTKAESGIDLKAAYRVLAQVYVSKLVNKGEQNNGIKKI